MRTRLVSMSVVVNTATASAPDAFVITTIMPVVSKVVAIVTPKKLILGPIRDIEFSHDDLESPIGKGVRFATSRRAKRATAAIEAAIISEACNGQPPNQAIIMGLPRKIIRSIRPYASWRGY